MTFELNHRVRKQGQWIEEEHPRRGQEGAPTVCLDISLATYPSSLLVSSTFRKAQDYNSASSFPVYNKDDLSPSFQ